MTCPEEPDIPLEIEQDWLDGKSMDLPEAEEQSLPHCKLSPK